MMRLERAALVLAHAFLALAPLHASAQSDWIDAFPSPTAVALAACEELKVTAARKNFDNTRDDDAIAINLAGTYVTCARPSSSSVAGNRSCRRRGNCPSIHRVTQ